MTTNLLNFNEAIYLKLNPDVQELIAQGVYESGLAHFMALGQFEERKGVVFNGTQNNDTIASVGTESFVSGVPIRRFTVQGENFAFSAKGSGIGQFDTLVGSEGANVFILGQNGNLKGSRSKSFYVGNGDADYALIQNFDKMKDSIFLAGSLLDYDYETIDGNLRILTREEGDLIAIIEGGANLTPFPLNNPGSLILADVDNIALQESLRSRFFEPYYAFNNPQAVTAVANGEYASVYDYYLQVGRFLTTGIQFTYWNGTSGNDVVAGLGDDIGLFGVKVLQIQRQPVVPHGIIGIETEDTGVGTVDVLIRQGGGGETVYNLGKTGLLTNPNPAPFYVGRGDADYALIKNFDPLAEEQFISLVGAPSDYSIEQRNGNTRISYHNDLIAIVEGTFNVGILPFFSRDGRFFLASLDAEGFAESVDFNFYEDLYLQLNPDVVAAIERGEYESAFDHYEKTGRYENREGVIFNGSGLFGGNDIVTNLGSDGEAVLIGVPISHLEVTEDEQVAIDTSSNGTGQRDTLIGTTALEIFVLGKNVSLENPTPTSFYVGNGDADFARIWNFDPTKDFLSLAGSLNDYRFEGIAPYREIGNRTKTPIWEKEVKIYTKDGDLIAIIDGIDSLTPFPVDNPGSFLLVSGQNTFLHEAIEPSFYAPLYPEVNSDVLRLIQKGRYSSYFDHLVNAGQYEDREDTFFVGTAGDDVLVGLGAESVLVGVAISDATYPPPDVKPVSTGVGEVDVLIGSLGENIFGLGNGILINDQPQAFYIGQGDADYALIKNFDPDHDFIIMPGLVSDYTFENVDGNTRIAKDGDLIALVEGAPNMIAYPPDFGGFYVAGTANLELEEFYKPTFNADYYLALNSDAAEAIANGEYESAYDYYLNNGGQLTATEGQAFTLWEGKAGRDFIGGVGASYGVIGVKVTGFEIADGKPSALETETTGTGDRDFLYGAPGENIFYLGTFGTASQTFYLGNGDEDHARLINFDPQQDYIALAGSYEQYTFEAVEGNLEISQDGDLVALVEGVTELNPFTGSTPEGATYLLSLENEFFSTFIEPAFYEPIYPVQNPDVIPLVESGQYTSYYDHFLQAGQFELREDTFFVGTDGDDTLYSLGYESVLVGVPISQAQYDGGIDVVPLSTGEGTIDTLFGGNLFETIFILGNSAILNETAQSFYVGQGDADYALIKNFGLNDRIFLGSDASLFTQTVVDGDLHIAKDGDLIAIVEGKTKLTVDGDELHTPDIEFYTVATAGNDLIFPGSKLNIIGVPLTETADGTVLALTTGVGEFDTLYDKEPADSNSNFYLGLATVDSPDTPVPFYLGNGDTDYALIKNFDPIIDHSVIIAGKFDDYDLEIVEGNTRISKEGDLVAIVENVTLVPDIDDGDLTFLYSADDEFYVENSQPFFNESIYLQENLDVADAVAADEFSSGYQHFMRLGLLEGRFAYYNGTSGNDEEIYAIGNSYVLGVPITGFDAATETFITGTTGMGEVDTLTGTVGINQFVLGSNSQTFYIGNGDADYAEINSFDPLKDEILLVGSSSDYTFNAVGENLNIAQNGDLVAIVNDITEISPDSLSFS